MSDEPTQPTRAKSSVVNTVIRLLLLVGGGVGLFSAGLVGTLGMRGKLSSEYLGPMLGIEAPEVDPAQLPDEPREGPVAKLPDESHEDTRAAQKKGGLLPDISLPSPFSAEETQLLIDELHAARADNREKVIQLRRQEKDLELVRIDLNRRWDDLNRREQELEERAKSLAAERQDIDGRSVVLKEAELSNLEQLAEKIEKMEAPLAALMLMEKTPERVAKILNFMKPRESGKILGEMPTEFASEVTERMLGVLKSDAGSENGGQ